MRIDDFQKTVEANSMLHISDTDIEIPGSEPLPKIPAKVMLQLSPTPQFLFKIDDLPDWTKSRTFTLRFNLAL